MNICIGHGNFLPWIEAEFGMHHTTANRFMQVAEAYSGKLSTVLNLDPSALYELAAPKTPQEVRTVRNLAEEYDAAQDRGEVATGRPKTLPNGNTSSTAAQVGLSSKEVRRAANRSASTAGRLNQSLNLQGQIHPCAFERNQESRCLSASSSQRCRL